MHGTVINVEWPTPGIARVSIGGDGMAGFEASPFTDSYVSVAIPPPGVPYEPPFELDALKSLPKEQRPFRRRYTVRSWDPVERVLTFDFVVHGDRGIAGPWAAAADPGDALVFTGPAGGYRPDPEADWHLMAGDESALPAIGASLEAVPAGAPVVVRLLCDGPEYELELDSPGNLDLRWLHRNGGDDEKLLVQAVADLEVPAGRVHGFIHGEAGETREVRRHLLADRGIAAADLSCSPYWRRPLTDEEWRQIKAAWNAEVAADVPDA